MMSKPTVLLLALAMAAAITGCNSTLEPTQARTSAPFEPTALIIVDETRPLTVEELEAQRPAIIGYLVRRGYLESNEALVDNPAMASRIIRVILSPSGSFRITEFTLGNRARQIITSSIIPGHSDNYDYDYGRYGYYNYLTARPYPEPPAYTPPANQPGDYQPAPPAERPPRAQRPDERPRRYERRHNPEGRGPDRTPRDSPRNDPGRSGSSNPPPSSPPPSYSPPPEPRASSSGESRYEEQHRPNDP